MESGVPSIQHDGEQTSNDVRRRLTSAEPKGLRTYTPSLAVLAESAGCYHWTPEGRKLADFTSGVLVANLGHNPVRWWQRVLEYLRIPDFSDGESFARMMPLTSYNATSELEVNCCERLLANMQRQPGGQRMEQVLWAASGSEAIQKALWASMHAAPGRDMILSTRHGFHGKKGLADAVTGTESDPDRDPRVRFMSFPSDACRDIHVRRQTTRSRSVRTRTGRSRHRVGGSPLLPDHGTVSGRWWIVSSTAESICNSSERFCRQRDIFFILDEIQSNFGRTGPMYAYTHYGIEPDIVCLGKGMGNGVPVSAAVGRADVLGSLDYGYGSDTWSANPLACAAVLATLDEFETTDVLDEASSLSGILERGLDRLKQTGLVANVRGEGCVWGVECEAVANHPASEVANACVKACYLGDDSGHAVHLLGPLAGKVLRVSPPLVMPAEEATEYLDAMFQIFQTLAGQLTGEAHFRTDCRVHP